ncbi:MAG: hypothetical protein AB7P52_08645 [Alphaproteobacteria bacterium]
MTARFAYRFSLAPALEPYRPEIEHALDFLDRAYGLKRDEAASRRLHYGAGAPPDALTVPVVLFPGGVRLDHDGIHPSRDALEAIAAGRGAAPLFPGAVAAAADGRLSYDAIGLIALMLTRLEERGAPSKDRYGRFPHAASLAARYCKLPAPPADRAAFDLAGALLGEAPRNATSYEVLLTHDVDRLRGYHRPLAPLRAAAGDLLKRRAPARAVKTLWRAYGGGEPWRSARRLMARSEARGLASRFYFMGPSTARMDSPYAVTMAPLLRRLVDEIRARGHAVGFHPGYGTQADPALWARQKAGLERIAGTPVSEGRQHVLGYEAARTPDIWAANRMALDLTLAYPETTGFRAGTCRRFRAYSLARRVPLALEQASTAVMDFGLFGGKYRELSVRQAFDEAAAAAALCRRFGGTLVLLQHTGTNEPKVDGFFETLVREVV